jgi:hypothetical protein
MLDRFAVVTVTALSLSGSGLSAQARLPRLVRVEIPALDSIGPELKSSTVAISPDGFMAFTGAFDERKRAVTVIDSRGTLVGRFGSPGRGPGEVNPPLQLSVHGQDVFVLEVAGRRGTRFTSTGKVVSSLPTPGSYFLIGAAGDSIDVLEWPTGNVPISDFRRVSTLTMEGRLIVGGQHPVVRAVADRAKIKGAAIATVLYASLGDKVVVANPNGYEIFVIDGKQPFYTVKRPPAAPGTVTTFKDIGGLHVDARKRLWVVNDPSPTGNSLADVYDGPSYLGSIDLGCRGNVALSGEWMAILCTNSASATKDVELRIFRILSA